jgi:hypothetical protein
MAGQPVDAAAFCANLVRSHDFARYASTLFLPGVHRRPMLAIYAFNVEISRVREQVSQPLPGEHVGPPLQADFAGQRLADLVAHATNLDVEGVQREQRAAGRSIDEQRRCVAVEIVAAHEVGAECGVGGRGAHGTAISAAATRRRSPIMML